METEEEPERLESSHHPVPSEIIEPSGELIEVPGPQLIHPVFIGPSPSSPVQSAPEAKPVAVQHVTSGSEGTTAQKQITPHV